ncbi:MAG: hypothetical protein RLY86_3739 [Pseudomonadota bacterium]|jgi:hypothetical protein
MTSAKTHQGDTPAEDGAMPPPDRSNRWFTIGVWVVLLSAAWSLPVLGLIEKQRAHAKMESGIYYTPRMPAEHYVQGAGTTEP